MTSPTLELQARIIQRLKADNATAAIVGARVYDSVPQGATFPYTALGPSDETSDDADCITAFEIAFQIDCFSRTVGFPQVRQLADAVRESIHGYDFELTTNALVSFEHRQTRFFRDPDGLTSHAAMTFSAFVEAP
jgi:hypothetical protein